MVVTKDSGSEGGTKEKILACKKAGIYVILIKMPEKFKNNLFFSHEEVINFVGGVLE